MSPSVFRNLLRGGGKGKKEGGREEREQHVPHRESKYLQYDPQLMCS
jgi:hypothetical protein